MDTPSPDVACSVPVPVRTREDLLDILDAAFADLSNEDLLSRLDEVEAAITELCKQTLLRLIGRDKRQEAHALGNVVYVGDRPLIFKLRPHVERDRALHVILQDTRTPRLNSNADYHRSEVQLPDSLGRYDTLQIVMPTSLGPACCDSAHTNIASIFAAGYFWLGERVRRALTLLESDFEQQSLHLFRRQFFIQDRETLSRQVWLVMVEENRVLYAVDGDVVGRVLRSAQGFSEELQQSPASIAAALLNNSISLSVSFSKEAIASGQTIEMDLANTPYQDVAEDFRAAQGAIYADRMSLTPLVGDRRHWLLAAYPSIIRSQVEDLLDAARADLDEYLRSTKARMRPIVKRLVSTSSEGKVAEYAGQFVWGMIKGMMGH